MSRKVPRKNIVPIISDVRHEKTATPPPSPPDNTPRLSREHIARFVRGVGDWGTVRRTGPDFAFRVIGKIILIFGCVAVAVFAGAFFVHSHVVSSVHRGTEGMKSAADSLESFDFAGMNSSLQVAENSFASASPPGMETFAPLLERFVPMIKNSAIAVKSIQELVALSLSAAAATEDIFSHGIEYILNGKGKALIESLQTIANTLEVIEGKAKEINAVVSSLPAGRFPEGSNALSLGVELARYRKFLTSALSWLREENPHHLAVFFGNTAELRPGGGFLGSFADVTIHGGQIENIEIHDISEIDRTATRRIVPPHPLQAIIKNWRAADANWFFDFGQSARKILSSLDASDFYRARGTEFDGAISITPRVVSDILDKTGEIAAGGRKITSENFLEVIQRDVQRLQSSGEKNTKTILADLVPILAARVASSTEINGRFWLSHIPQWVEQRDILAYFRDPKMQQIVEFGGTSGGVFTPSNDFNGDYFGFTEANIGGQKTDLVVRKKISYRATLGNDGVISKRVSISLRHEGEKESEWWYREPLKAYMTIYSLPGAALSSASGAWLRKIPSPLLYEKNGYTSDPDVIAEEQSAKANFNFPAIEEAKIGNNDVLRFWMNVSLGASSTASIEYAGRTARLPEDGRAYEFVFERQAGLIAEYDIEIAAPVGFVWKENNSPIFEYKNSNMPGRFTLLLTLKKAG